MAGAAPQDAFLGPPRICAPDQLKARARRITKTSSVNKECWDIVLLAYDAETYAWHRHGARGKIHVRMKTTQYHARSPPFWI